MSKKASRWPASWAAQNTEINDQTVDVLIESAYFSPTNIRRTSKALGLRSESSYRFERGADVGICDWASRRAAQLILETAGGQLAEGVVDAYPKPRSSRSKSRCISRNPRTCSASAFPTRNRFRFT
jgi:phenylalanyl-tRNA synthetase beta chain